MGPVCCPETSVTNYEWTLRDIPEGRISHSHRGGSLPALLFYIYFFTFSFFFHWLCLLSSFYFHSFLLPSFLYPFPLSHTSSFLPCVFVSVTLIALTIQRRKFSVIWSKNKVSGAEWNQFKKFRPDSWWLLNWARSLASRRQEGPVWSRTLSWRIMNQERWRKTQEFHFQDINCIDQNIMLCE